MAKQRVQLVEALHNPSCYPHQVDRVRLIETHISWVFLAGSYAYKLKKPVNFGFLDFSTLNKRQHFCEEELRLNRRFAPQLYLDVVSIGGSPDSPQLGELPAIDFMVRMKRFSRHNELDQLLQQNRLTPEIIEQFADYLADLHQQAPSVDPHSAFGSPATTQAPIVENFRQLRPLLPDSKHQQQLDSLEQWAETRSRELTPLLQQRKIDGLIRECHGDVHLANMVWHNDQPLLFDCIEFNDNFRCIDPVNDYAFLLMDLDDRGAELLSGYFLNRYLRQSGDYRGLPLLDYYRCYRAMVRAKVFALRLQQSGLSEAEREKDLALTESYLRLAETYLQPGPAGLFITHGFSGSGKSTFVRQLAPRLGAISLDSDIERKRLFGLTATAATQSPPAGGIYSSTASQKTYQQLQELARALLQTGFPVIVDACFLKQEQRKRLQAVADRQQVPFSILEFCLPEAELFRRVGQRSRQAEQVSEADTAVLRQQLLHAEPLTTAERAHCLEIGSDRSPAAVAAEIEKICHAKTLLRHRANTIVK